MYVDALGLEEGDLNSMLQDSPSVLGILNMRKMYESIMSNIMVAVWPSGYQPISCHPLIDR